MLFNGAEMVCIVSTGSCICVTSSGEEHKQKNII